MSEQGDASAAEFSVIGALLQRPQMAGAVGRWLKSSDFADPWMERVFHALVEQQYWRHPHVLAAGPGQSHLVLARLLVPQMRANAAAAQETVPDRYWPQVQDMLAFHLVHPNVTTNPDAAVEYGRGVLWGKIRRTVASGGEALATAASTYSQGMAGVSLAAADGMDEIAGLRQRWDEAVPTPSSQGPVEEVPLMAHPVPQSDETDLLLATLVLNPSQVAAVPAFIEAKHFGGTYGPALYRQVLAAAEVGVGLVDDQPLMLWALQVRARHGLLDAGTSRPEVRQQATAVFRRYVRHVAQEGGGLMSHWASQGAVATRQVLGAAQRVLGAVAARAAQSQREHGLAAAGGFGYRAAT